MLPPPAPPSLPPASRAPTPGQAFALFGAGFVTLLLAAQGVEWIARLRRAPPVAWRERAADPTLDPLLTNGGWIVALTAVPELALGALLLAVVRLRGFSRRLVLPLTRPSARALIGSLLLAFGVAPAADWIYSWALHAPWMPTIFADGVSAGELVTRSVGDQGLPGLLLAVLGLAVVPAIVEEAVFRGFVTAAFAGSDVAAWLAPTVLFALFHLDPAQVLATGVLGLAFGLARLCTGSLLASMAAHAAYNATVLVLAFVGGAAATEDPSASGVVAGLALGVVGLLLLVGPARRPATPPGASAAGP
jgi:membrane protease YdiL (CAAX protease family)